MKSDKTHGFRFAATDLSNHLSCDHLTQLQRLVALGKLERPVYNDPTLAALRQRGEEHEDAYVEHLKKQGLKVLDLSEKDFAATRAAMKSGISVIVQARLEHNEWIGFADILIKIPGKSDLGDWSYEVQDTKLALETRPGAMLQLCLYAELVESIQGKPVEKIHVVKPGAPFTIDSYRVDDFRAYYNLIKNDLVKAAHTTPPTYPRPVDHCSICAWWQRCSKQRRDDDHLSLVAGIRTAQIDELEKQEIHKLETFAKAKKLEKPDRGSLKSLEKKKDQAVIQLEGREENTLKHRLLAPEKDRGFMLLPPPSEGDIYFDIEGDRYYPDGGLEYLLGYYSRTSKVDWVYEKLWAYSREEEKKSFIAFMDFVMKRWKKFPDMCIYHYAPYEPTALTRLSRMYAVYEEEVDRLLRGNRLIDLHSVVKGALIASVERYSLKDMEKFAKYLRVIDLRHASLSRRHIECALELNERNSITDEDRIIVEGYNQDDCIATKDLHEWMEGLRNGTANPDNDFPRLIISDGVPENEERKETATKNEALRKALIKNHPSDPTEFSEEQRATWLLAHMVEYFSREEKSNWWEYYAIRRMDDDDLTENRKVILGLHSPQEQPKKGKERNITIRYEFPPQETDIGPGDDVDDVWGGTVGEVVGISIQDWTIDIKKAGKASGDPRAIQIKPKSFKHNALADSIFTIATSAKDFGLGIKMPFGLAKDLLLKNKPRFVSSQSGSLLHKGEDHVTGAIRLASGLDNSVLPIQGPPGSGKTYTGARMILDLVKEKQKVGVTAFSHKAIRNLLAKVKSEATKEKFKVSVFHKSDGSFDDRDGVIEAEKNEAAFEAIGSGSVVGGTAWLWAREDAVGLLDYLFVDEAGQMSLTNVLTACRSARNLILLGDPQQLEQPLKGSHPEGSDVAALSYLLGGKQTIAEDRGIFIPTTRRLHPAICQFTSELFYESRLEPIPGLDKLVIGGKTHLAGAGLFYVPVIHTGNQSKSVEEVAVIKRIVEDLVQNGTWTDANGEPHKISKSSIAIVTPYNAQIAALGEQLAGYAIGTVDKFQGQEAPVVIYSMASSSAEDAPRGMPFLYSPNRLNVATSRAMCACILVASPKLFEPECKSVDQMRWANAMCRYKELAKEIDPAQIT